MRETENERETHTQRKRETEREWERQRERKKEGENDLKKERGSVCMLITVLWSVRTWPEKTGNKRLQGI